MRLLIVAALAVAVAAAVVVEVDGQGKGPKGKLPIGWKKLSLTAEQEKAIRKARRRCRRQDR